MAQADTSNRGMAGGGPTGSEGPLAPSDSKKLWVPWEAEERVRPPWTVKGHFGSKIPPLKNQKTNNELSNEEVMQSRTEPIGASHAFPIRGTDFESTEPTHHKGISGNSPKGINL